MNWFECKISYEKMMDNGVQKKVTESYLVDALSFTEAEARIVEEMKPFISSAEKKTAANMIAQASDIKNAIAIFEIGMKGALADYVIASVSETTIMDVFPFSHSPKK
jgi:hypothetical protein